MRLQKYIAHAGIASRRKAEELIRSGKVKVNGTVIKDMGVVIDPELDIVSVDDRIIYLDKKKIYIMLYKPEGYVTTVSDQFNRPTVMDLVKDIPERIYPVGRLDYDTAGLLLMTNDGDLAFRLTHPKYSIIKKYICRIQGIPTDKQLNQFRTGIDIGGYVTAPAYIQILKQYKHSRDCLVEVRIHEGKNRQIRKMFDKINHPVIQLKRVAIGELSLKGLQVGQWRYLTKKEIRHLKTR